MGGPDGPFSLADLPAQAPVAVYTLQEKRKTRWNPPLSRFWGMFFWGSMSPMTLNPPTNKNEKHHFDLMREVYSQILTLPKPKKNIQKITSGPSRNRNQKKKQDFFGNFVSISLFLILATSLLEWYFWVTTLPYPAQTPMPTTEVRNTTAQQGADLMMLGGIFLVSK